jgi:hypothetical protein
MIGGLTNGGMIMDKKKVNRRQILGGVAVTAGTAGLLGQTPPKLPPLPKLPCPPILARTRHHRSLM